MFAVSFVFKKFNKDSNDYFRNGCQGTWWLIGTSAFMGAFSAWTFTGAAGVVYTAGWSVIFLYLSNSLGFVFNAVYLAPRFRQMRLTTGGEIILARYGLFTQQYLSYTGFLFYGYVAALHLYGLCIFTSAIFGFDIQTTIVIIGAIVLFYSMVGGSWAVKATDFLQSLLLIPITILIAILSLRFIGGFGPMNDLIHSLNLTEHFRPINTIEFSDEMIDFSIYWAIAITLDHIISYNSMGAAPRYFAAKDGREASKAAWLACIMMTAGAFIWLIPPMIARLTIPEQVDAMAIASPAESSYALISLKLLPEGMAGLIAVAIFAATMSSMDSGLNGSAANLVKNILPPLFKLSGREQPSLKAQLRIGQVWTLICGIIIICIALYLSKQEGKGIFRYMLILSLLLPASQIPLLLGLFIKRVPWWSAILTMTLVWPVGLFMYFSGKDPFLGVPLMSHEYKWHWGVLLKMGAGALVFMLTMPFWKYSSAKYKAQVEDFFTLMKTPVDFEKEV
ncbi:MAG: sodium:solute symporter family transporter, partial [Puniceicoccales bacterium]